MAKAVEKDDIAIHKRWFTIFHIAPRSVTFPAELHRKSDHIKVVFFFFFTKDPAEETFFPH
jgi:hypothetical protein